MTIKKIITEEHYCDICERRTTATNIQLCVSCGKELCSYCRFALMRVRRKYPDNGYSATNQKEGNVCVICAKKKLGMKVEILDYPK